MTWINKKKSILGLVSVLFLLCATVAGSWHPIEVDSHSACVFEDSFQKVDSSHTPCRNSQHKHHKHEKCLLCRFAHNSRIQTSVWIFSFTHQIVGENLSCSEHNPTFLHIASNFSRAPPALG